MNSSMPPCKLGGPLQDRPCSPRSIEGCGGDERYAAVSRDHRAMPNARAPARGFTPVGTHHRSSSSLRSHSVPTSRTRVQNSVPRTTRADPVGSRCQLGLPMPQWPPARPASPCDTEVTAGEESCSGGRDRHETGRQSRNRGDRNSDRSPALKQSQSQSQSQFIMANIKR